MRIAHVNFARGFRGGERQTLNLIEGLATQGVSQVLICRSRSELARRVGALGVAVREVAHPLLGHLASQQVDLIHVHEARGAYWACIENKLRDTPYVITRRIPNPISACRITAAVYAGAAQLFGVSQDVSRHLSQRAGRPVQTILSSSTGMKADPGLVQEIRTRLGGPDIGPVIGHVGALHDRHKGQSVLIQAFQMLLRDFPSARLVLVGEGVDRAEFERLAGGDARIHFAGFQEQVGSWIAAMDLFCFPSREEGLGSTVLDAMSLGVPVIAAAVGGLPELVGREQRGRLIANHDPASWMEAMRDALQHPRSQAARVAAAREFAARNGVLAMSRSYLAAYRRLLPATAAIAASELVR
ncbi:MAG TPA: glycosyltransferase [Burkholderiaceae bacterium]